MAILFLESATSATQGFEWYSSTTGSVSSVTTPLKYGPNSILLTDVCNCKSKLGIVPNTARLTWWVYPTGGSGDDTYMQLGKTSEWSFLIRVTSALGIQFGTGASTKDGTAVLTTNSWTRIAVTWAVTSISNWSAKVYYATVDGAIGTLDITVSNADFNLTSAVADNSIAFGNEAAGVTSRISPWYLDDDTSTLDPGDIRVTFKRPNALSTNNFGTAMGGATTPRYDYVNELPLDAGDGWSQLGETAQQEESYGIQSASQGSINISGRPVIGRMAWAWVQGGGIGLSKSYYQTITGATKTTTTTFPSQNVVNGDLIVVGFADQILGTTPTLAKSAGTSTIGAVTALTTATSTVRLSKWWIPVTGTGTLTLQFTHDNSASTRAGVYIGFVNATASPADKNPANTTDGTSQYDGPSTTTLTQADEVVVSFFAFAGPTGDNVALVGTSDRNDGVTHTGTTGGGASSNSNLWMNYRVTEATTAVAVSMTNSTANRAGVQGIASFKLASNMYSGTAKLINNGVDVAATLPLTNGLIYNLATSTEYPATAGVIGLKSTGAYQQTYFMEGGMLIAYDNSTFLANPPYRKLQAVNRKATY